MNNKLIIAGNHIGNPEIISSAVIVAIIKYNIIICESKDTIKDIILKHNIDTSNKKILIYDFVHETEFINKIKNLILQEDNVLFIADNGMPGFADVGIRLVNECYIANIKVDVIPGPSIISTLPVIAGVLNDNNFWTFQEFFDMDNSIIIDKLRQMKDLNHNLILIHRANEASKFLKSVLDIFTDNRYFAVCVNVGLPDQEIIRGRLPFVIKETEKLISRPNIVVSTVCSAPLSLL